MQWTTSTRMHLLVRVRYIQNIAYLGMWGEKVLTVTATEITAFSLVSTSQTYLFKRVKLLFMWK